VSVQVFVYVVVAAAAALAFWILARFARFGPRTLVWAGVHVVLAYVLLRLTPVFMGLIGAADDVVRTYVAVFGLVLPMFVYVFVSGGWVTRVAMGMLRR
jgi:hypothetical protein